MKTIPNSNYKIEINNQFITTAKIELYIFKKQGFFAKRKYDFKNIPILNYLDKSFHKYIFNLEAEINDSYSRFGCLYNYIQIMISKMIKNITLI